MLLPWTQIAHSLSWYVVVQHTLLAPENTRCFHYTFQWPTPWN